MGILTNEVVHAPHNSCRRGISPHSGEVKLSYLSQIAGVSCRTWSHMCGS